MEITDILQAGFIASSIAVASTLIGLSLDITYANKIRRLQEQRKLKKLPLYAQELSRTAQRSMKVGEKKGALRGHFHYQLCEMPTFKAAYNFLTLNNPEYRGLFFD